MAGRVGRSGGANRLSPEEHRLRGTSYRKPPVVRPAVVAAADSPALVVMPEDLVTGLQGPGRAFAEKVFNSHDGWATHELALLRQAARCLDDAEMASGPGARQSAIRLFAIVVGQLRLLPPQPPAAPDPLDEFIKRPTKWAGILK